LTGTPGAVAAEAAEATFAEGGGRAAPAARAAAAALDAERLSTLWPRASSDRGGTPLFRPAARGGGEEGGAQGRGAEGAACAAGGGGASVCSTKVCNRPLRQRMEQHERNQEHPKNH
jgi:hypothetical protein